MRTINWRSAIIAIMVTVVLAILIYLGSAGLTYFDSALIGYATASLFAVLGITYRFVNWLDHPPTRRYWLRGWQLFLSWRTFRRYMTLVPRAWMTDLALQDFIWPRGVDRWIMHFTIFWGVILSSLITFPLVFGWLHFELVGQNDYQLFITTFPVLTFPLGTIFAFSLFHALDFTAVLVIVGAYIALWRRWRDRAVIAGQEFGFDFVPLLLLLAIALTGLLLTASQLWWEGQFYWFIALSHEAVVILAILYIPFGKFWHVLERPASVGIKLYRTVAGALGMARCPRCGREFEPILFVQDLKNTLRELDQNYTMTPDGAWLQDYCPECKRVLRNSTYFERVEQGFL
ncbi:MAG: MFS transporter [Chloroflexota bacterium]|nr:MAG: MFS transporter [Chloroflexota bacterium]